MSTLAALLRCLARRDITEVRLQSDAAAVAATLAGSWAPLTKAPLSTAQITQIVAGTPIADALHTLGESVASQLTLTLEDSHYTVRLLRQQQRLQLCFVRTEPVAVPEPVKIAVPEPVKADIPESVKAAVPEPVKVPSPAGPATASHGAGTPVGADPQALTAILAAARAQQASDVHLAADCPLRMRRYGELSAQGEPIAARQLDSMLQAILTPAQQLDVQTRGYADLALSLPQAGRLRVNVSRQASGLKGCFRLVADEVATLASLGLPKEVQTIAQYHQGLAIISGPNGQGKTTTLAAIVDLINSTSPYHIITVEDPVEFMHPVKRAVLSQREVGSHTLSFERALKACLREDPDVIVIGELRDRETVEIALTAAETGHLVIATMRTRSAAKTIDRLIDLFAPDEQPQVRATLAGALKMIISQRLLPAVLGGQVAAAEIITGSVPLWSLIRDNKLFQLGSLQQRGRSLGMIKFDTSLQELVQAGKITVETAKKYAENSVELERCLAAVPLSPTGV